MTFSRFVEKLNCIVTSPSNLIPYKNSRNSISYQIGSIYWFSDPYSIVFKTWNNLKLPQECGIFIFHVFKYKTTTLLFKLYIKWYTNIIFSLLITLPKFPRYKIWKRSTLFFAFNTIEINMLLIDEMIISLNSFQYIHQILSLLLLKCSNIYFNQSILIAEMQLKLPDI